MKKHSNKRRNHSRAKANLSQTKPKIIDLGPEELAVYARLAEKEVLPTIEDMELSAGAAIFLLAQYARSLITGNSRLTLESATSTSNDIIRLWQAGLYQPSSQYPFTLEETLSDLKNGMKAQADYSAYFQPFTPVHPLPPRGVGQIAGGIVRHPKTHLWQIWLIFDGPCEFLGAYHNASTAQEILEELINMTRKGNGPGFAEALYRRLITSRGDGDPQQISFDMMSYLIDNLKAYSIEL